MSTRVEQLKKVQHEAMNLFIKKNQDYGDAFAKYGPVGVLMRMNDKVSRLQSITKTGIVLVNDEKIRDTLIDLHNYSAMAVMLLDEGEEMKYPDNYEPFNDTDDIFQTCQGEDLVENSSDKVNFDNFTDFIIISGVGSATAAVALFVLKKYFS